MSGKEVDVRVVPHHGEWAVKLTGGIGIKPIRVTPRLEEARKIAASIAVKYQVPLIEFDSNGSLVGETPWIDLSPHTNWRKR